MQKYAVIDIGSNSVRLMLVANGKVLYKRLNTTRLGENLAKTGRLQIDAIERTALAVCAFAVQAQQDGAEQVLAFATASVRSAKNGVDFVSRVKELGDIDVEVVSGETEAEIGVLGALGSHDGALIDIGGASTELVVKISGDYVYKKSVDVGVVRLKDSCLDDSSLVSFCQNAVSLFGRVPTLTNVYAVGGTATTLVSLALGLQEYDSKKITGAILTQSSLLALIERLQKMSIEEIALLPCMPKGRADVIKNGAVWLYTLMQSFAIREICVSDRDNLEGYALKKGLMV